MKKHGVARIAPGVKGLIAGAAVAVLLAAGCKKAVEEAPGLDKPAAAIASITAFALTEPVKAAGVIDKQRITVVVPAGTPLTALKAKAELSPGAAVEPDPAEARDYTGPVRYAAGAARGAQTVYTVDVRYPSAEDCAIGAFRIGDAAGLINQEDKTIAVTVPYGTDLTNLSPVIMHTGESVTPASGAARDFSTGPVAYTVKSRGGTENTYAATARAALNPARAITSWKARLSGGGTASGVIDEAAKTVHVLLPYGTGLDDIICEVTHTGADIEPDPAEPRDYPTAQKFTVKAEDGATAEYAVTMIPGADIRSFTITAPVEAAGSIDRAAGTIGVTVPYETDVNAMRARVDAGAAKVSPGPAEARSYANPVTFTLSAEGQPDKTYTVTVARMAAGSYSVVYESRGAQSGSMAHGEFVYDTEYTLPKNNYERTGYTFDSWNTAENGTGTKYAGGAKVKNLARQNETATLYAQWKPNTYTVSYDLNGGSGTKPAATNFTYDAEQAVASSTGLSKTGYTFDGWTETAGGSGANYGAGTRQKNLAASGSITLYAKWEANRYKVTYAANAPAGAQAGGKTPDTTHAYGTASNLAANGFGVPGYTFDSWNAAANGSGAKYASGESVLNLTATANGAVTLYARWTANTYTVTFDANGGIGGQSGTKNATYDAAMPDINKTAPARAGYTFDGWYDQKDGGAQYYTAAGASAKKYDKAAGATLYARWKGSAYTVTLDVNGGNALPKNTVEANYGAALPALTGAAARTGYTLDGWYDAQNGGGTKYYNANGTSAKNYDKTAGATLYARWTANTYTVKYDANAPAGKTATETTGDTSHVYDTAKAPAANGFKVDGYGFAGWGTEKTGGTTYASGASVLNLTATAGGTVTLYARWSAAIPVDFVKIPGGTFMMGSPAPEKDRREDETQHPVTVSTFYISRYELTRAKYESVMGSVPQGANPFAATPYDSVAAKWIEAVTYCNKLSEKQGITPAYTIKGTNVTWNKSANGYRLPTEAEWEYVCRAGTTTAYYTGASINDDTGWYAANHSVKLNISRPSWPGKKPPNPWGLYDMAGNLAELCWDWYADYETAPQTNPSGPNTGEKRVVRGGSYNSADLFLRSACRTSALPDSSGVLGTVGFRVARNL